MSSMKWMYIKIEIPDDEGSDLLKYIQSSYGLKQIDEDWCTFKRKKDNAYVDISPCDEPINRKADW